MNVEIEKSGWETFINMVNHLCSGQKVILKATKNGQEVVIAQGNFMGIETYLKNPTKPLLMVILGNGNQVELTHFLKDPLQVVIEQEGKKIISCRFQTVDEDTSLQFLTPPVKESQVYHWDIA